jgi:hypothetical protein
MKTNSSSKLPNDNDTKLTSQGAAEVPETSKSSEGKRKVGKNKHASVYQKPWKKARNNRMFPLIIHWPSFMNENYFLY